MSPHPKDFRDFTSGYVECAIWSSTDDETPLDQNYNAHDLASETAERMAHDCLAFVSEHADLIDDYCMALPARVGDFSSMELAGHDLWLTRNHHGAGYWDRRVGAVGDKLTAQADQLGEQSLYVGDDGKLYL